MHLNTNSMSTTIPQGYLSFLTELRENNSREWMEEHKSRYQQLEADFKTFCKDTMQHMQQFDQLERVKVFRIYRDVRFSKNKLPYKTTRSAIFFREGAMRRGSYYFQIAPGASFVGGGFFKPEPADLLRIRKEFEFDAEPFRELLDASDFKKAFKGLITDDQVKTAPKGFSKEDPNIDLIRNRKFAIRHAFSDAEVLAEDFQENLLYHFQLMLPFFNYMTEVLITDLNGERIL